MNHAAKFRRNAKALADARRKERDLIIERGRILRDAADRGRITEVADAVGLSRARLYLMIRQGREAEEKPWPDDGNPRRTRR